MSVALLLASMLACRPDPPPLRVGTDDVSMADSQDSGTCDDPQTWYVDGDGDGHGDPEQPVTACEQPEGTASIGDDCRDDDAGLFPEEGLCAMGRTCLEWLDADPGLPDGTYAVDPDGSGVGTGPVRALCDMTGGGWTLVGLQDTVSQLVRTASDIGLGEDWGPAVTHRWGTARVKGVVPTVAWRITSTDGGGAVVDEAWFVPSCVIDWEVYVGTFQGRRETQDDACGIAYVDETFTEILGGSYTENNCSLGIGQNNNGAYCSIRMGSCNCHNDSCGSTWAPEEGVATPCSVFDYADYVMRLWMK